MSKNPIGFRFVDRPLLLIISFNKLVPGVNFRDWSKPLIGSVEFQQDLYEVSPDSDCRIESPGIASKFFLKPLLVKSATCHFESINQL
jgi:hypothetical protein